MLWRGIHDNYDRKMKKLRKALGTVCADVHSLDMPPELQEKYQRISDLIDEAEREFKAWAGSQ